MAFDSSNLVLLASGPNGQLLYAYEAGSDSMATVAAAGYFNNSDDDLNLTVNDKIEAACSDGDVTLRVESLSSGSVTTTPLGDGPYRGDVSAANATLAFGFSEIGSGTGSTFTLPTPVVGAKVRVQYNGTATAVREVVTSATGVTINAQGDRTIPLDSEGHWIELKAVSTTRWAILGGNYGTLA